MASHILITKRYSPAFNTAFIHPSVLTPFDTNLDFKTQTLELKFKIALQIN